jgi:segregation and condensation protein B
MPPVHLRSAVEALLFSSDQPLPLSLLAEALDTAPESVSEALTELGADYKARESGVELREMAGGWIVTTTAEQHEWVARMLRGKRKMRLSRAALETLAIIAYKQPVTKSEIEAIRGVDSSGTLATLLERSLVTIKGRSTLVGRPLLYGSTGDFLNYFGLNDLTELPRPEELRALVAAREPEQMEMLELDPDGMPLSLGAGTPAGEEAATEAPATHVAGDTLEASDAGVADEDHDDDEFEGDDEDDEDDDDDEEVEGDDVDDESGGDDESERPSASFAKRPSR